MTMNENPIRALRVERRGLKCDAPTCDYVDDGVKDEDYEKYLNAPCPKCGASLLTPEDFEAIKMLHALADLITTIGGGPLREDESVDNSWIIPIKMDGTGNIKLGNIYRKDDKSTT
jgi:hypothetical protein